MRSCRAACFCLLRPVGRWLGSWLLVLVGFGLRPACAAEYKPLPPAAPTGLSADGWLLHDVDTNRLILYLPGYHAPSHSYYQWVQLVPRQPLRLTFEAAKGLSLFLDNQLIFTALKPGSYVLDLSGALPAQARAGQHLLAVWQPDGYPALGTFGTGPPPRPVAAPAARVAAPVVAQAAMRLAPSQNESVLVVFLLLLGLLYGWLRAAYPAGLARIFQVNELIGSSSEPQAFLARPAFTWLNFGLVVLFSLSLALLLTALHPDFSNLPLLQRVLSVPESALVLRVFAYTGLVLGFVLGKFLLVELMSYIFDLRELVNLHFREFLRTSLLLGLLLPLALLLYLGLNVHWPGVVGLGQGAVLLVLTLTVLRVARTLHHEVPLLNLHLFAYLCATEILPLAVLLKLIVFTYPA